jgi:glycosyltransferase involved in cell wall biosynthesis
MKLVFLNYGGDPTYGDPLEWLKRIAPTAGILESLARSHDVVGIEHINYEGNFEAKGVHYHFTQIRERVIRFPGRLHRLVQNLHPDVVFVNGFIFPMQIIQLRWKLGRDVKIIVVNHAEQPATGVKKMLQKWADSMVEGYFFTSRQMAVKWVDAGIISQMNKVHEVMEASSVFGVMEKEKARKMTGISGERIFLWVGRLDANKDPMTVIKAFKEFLEAVPSSKLYMIYHTNQLENTIKQYCSGNGCLEKAVKLVGNVSHEELAHWYNSADFFISASHYEGSGIAVCEAMSCRCIPLLTDIPSFRKMTGPGKCGFLYEKGNVSDLLKLLLQTKEMNLETEKEKTRTHFNQELSFSAIGRQINEVLSTMKTRKGNNHA